MNKSTRIKIQINTCILTGFCIIVIFLYKFNFIILFEFIFKSSTTSIAAYNPKRKFHIANRIKWTNYSNTICHFSMFFYHERAFSLIGISSC